MTFTVNITQDHISEGVPNSPGSCPIACAVYDTMPNAKTIRVGSKTCYIRLENDSRFEFKLPEVAQDFIWKYDRAGSTEPFTFEVMDSAISEIV